MIIGSLFSDFRFFSFGSPWPWFQASTRLWLRFRLQSWSRCGFGLGFTFPNLPLRLTPIPNCRIALAASLLVQFVADW